MDVGGLSVWLDAVCGLNGLKRSGAVCGTNGYGWLGKPDRFGKLGKLGGFS